jgi:hypothetical protein
VPGGIPEKQWSLPAGFLAGSGRTAALKRVVDPNYRTTDVHELDDAQRCALTLKRIARQRTFEFMTLDGQTVTKRRALGEVRKQTPLGRTLIDIEHRTIALMCEWIRTQQMHASSVATAGVLPAQSDASEAFRAHLDAPAPDTPGHLARARRSARIKTPTVRASARTAAKNRQQRRSR